MNPEDKFDRCINETREVEKFLFSFIRELTKRRLKSGEDVSRYAEECGLEIPEMFKGTPIYWAEKEVPSAEDLREEPLVFARPGVPHALGLTIGCIRWGKWRACLECGWFWCRVVVTRRF